MLQRKAFHTCLTFVTTIVTALCLSVGMATAAKVLKYSDHDPSGGLRTKFYKEIFLAEIEKQTEGRIKIQDFWGGALLSAPEALQGIGDGVADMGMVYADFNPKQLLLHQGFKAYPTGPGNYDILMRFYKDVYEQIPEFSDELKKFNQKVIYISPSLPTAFISNKPFESLDKLKGGKWRASSRWHLLFLKNAGATAMFIPWGEMYMSLQTGAVDGCMANYDGLHMTRQDEVAPNILVARELWFATPFMVTINLDVWNGLPREDQAGINKAAEIALEKYNQTYSDGVVNIFETEKKNGQNPRYLSIEEVNAWASTCATANAPQIWLEDLEKARIKNAASIVSRLSELHKKAIEKDQKVTAAAQK